MNEIILIIETIAAFSTIVLLKKVLGKDGLFLWIGLASVMANIQVVKSVELFGITATLGNVLFSSVFLATDLLRECYGKENAKKGVYIGVVSILIYLAVTQITLMYEPNLIDYSHSSMQVLFAFSPRICTASLTMYAISNFLDVFVYDRLHKIFNGEKLWLRNNVSTIICNGLENFGFVFLAFAGVYPANEIINIAVSTTVIEILIAVWDTPFIYLGKAVKE